MKNPDAPPVKVLVARPGWVPGLSDAAALEEWGGIEEFLRCSEGLLVLVPSPADRLGLAAALLRLAGCRWRLTLLGEGGGDAAVWLVGANGDSALLDSAGYERLAAAAVLGPEAMLEALERDLGPAARFLTPKCDR